MEPNVKKTSFNIGYVLLAVLAWMLLRGRARAGERYAGLRILRR